MPIMSVILRWCFFQAGKSLRILEQISETFRRVERVVSRGGSKQGHVVNAANRTPCRPPTVFYRVVGPARGV